MPAPLAAADCRLCAVSLRGTALHRRRRGRRTAAPAGSTGGHFRRGRRAPGGDPGLRAGHVPGHRLGLGALVGETRPRPTQYFYLSAETFTTLGLGDIYPTGDLRLIASLEPLIGMLLTASQGHNVPAVQRHWIDLQSPGGRVGPQAPPASHSLPTGAVGFRGWHPATTVGARFRRAMGSRNQNLSRGEAALPPGYGACVTSSIARCTCARIGVSGGSSASRRCQ